MGPLPLAGSGIYEYSLWMASIEDRNFFRVFLAFGHDWQTADFCELRVVCYAFLFVVCRGEPRNCWWLTDDKTFISSTDCDAG